MRMLSRLGFAFAGLLGVVQPALPLSVARTVNTPAAASGGRSRSRNRYSGAELRRIRREGQARECARRLRRKAVQA